MRFFVAPDVETEEDNFDDSSIRTSSTFLLTASVDVFLRDRDEVGFLSSLVDMAVAAAGVAVTPTPDDKELGGDSLAFVGVEGAGFLRMALGLTSLIIFDED